MTSSRILNLSTFRPLLGRSPRRLLLLAPSTASARTLRPTHDTVAYNRLIAQLQALRGGVYVKEAFLRPEDLKAGRHQVAIDEKSWHLLLLEKDGRVCGCIRYRECANKIDYSQLMVGNSALARCQRWGGRFERAVQDELAFARDMDLPYIELGGWALAENVRGTSEALRMALAIYALSQMLGHAVGISTARQTGSAPVLKKIGGRSLEHEGEALPAYYDPMYRSMIEVLRFYSWAPNPRFQSWIEEIKSELREVPVLTGARSRTSPLRNVAPVWQTARPEEVYVRAS